jgi:hypothetical protein
VVGGVVLLSRVADPPEERRGVPLVVRNAILYLPLEELEKFYSYYDACNRLTEALDSIMRRCERVVDRCEEEVRAGRRDVRGFVDELRQLIMKSFREEWQSEVELWSRYLPKGVVDRAYPEYWVSNIYTELHISINELEAASAGRADLSAAIDKIRRKIGEARELVRDFHALCLKTTGLLDLVK